MYKKTYYTFIRDVGCADSKLPHMLQDMDGLKVVFLACHLIYKPSDFYLNNLFGIIGILFILFQQHNFK